MTDHEKIIQAVEAKQGKGSMIRMGDKPNIEVETYSSGSIGLDIALGIGGFPRGRIIEIYGPESSGKTTLALNAIAACQKAGGIAAFVDAEHALDPIYAEALGVNVDNLLLSQPDSGEQALEIVDHSIATGLVNIIVIDSVAALVPKAELEGEMGDSKMGLQARLMSQAMRKLTASIGRTNTCCIFLNQLREKIGVTWGNPETTTGGNALKFYASIRLDIRKSGSDVKDKEGNIIASPRKCKVVKNKLAPPFRIAKFDMAFGLGIDKWSELLDCAVELDIIKKSGAWYAFDGSNFAQGRVNAAQMFRDNEEFMQTIQDLVEMHYED